MKDDLCVPQDKPSDPGFLGIQFPHSSIRDPEGVLVRGEHHHFCVSMLLSLHMIFDEGERENVNVPTRLKHEVLYDQQSDHIGLHFLEEKMQE